MTRATAFTAAAGVRTPLICGPMFPCSNPELVAAVSAAGGLGVVQPMSLASVHGWDFRDGLRRIRELSGGAPVGLNILLEHGFRRYQRRLDVWIDIALEQDVRFFLTALGHPRPIVERIHAAGGLVYHDVTGRGFAAKAVDAGVDGLICVNDRAGGHAGRRSQERLFAELSGYGLPLVCAGGVGTPQEFRAALDAGYAAVQCGTRFIATDECTAGADYKAAILAARAADIVLTEKLTGVPLSVIRTPAIDRLGLEAGGLAKRLLRHPRTKKWMRAWYLGRSLRRLPAAARDGGAYRDLWQAGRSVEGIDAVLPAGEVVRGFAAALGGGEAGGS
ncbi:MAG: nitronate monooxygenase [Candidatus Latescibacteria bacterium]|nr:nitronate monooxygenase [Candidatus Latescibacterota bacterium]